MQKNSNVLDPYIVGDLKFTEPIINSGKSYGIKLLSVYDFLRCDSLCKNLVDRLVEQGLNKKICDEICERACIVSMCLYDTKNERIFPDAMSAICGLTPYELKKIYHEYEILNKKTIRLDKLTSSILDDVRKYDGNIYKNKFNSNYKK